MTDWAVQHMNSGHQFAAMFEELESHDWVAADGQESRYFVEVLTPVVIPLKPG